MSRSAGRMPSVPSAGSEKQIRSIPKTVMQTLRRKSATPLSMRCRCRGDGPRIPSLRQSVRGSHARRGTGDLRRFDPRKRYYGQLRRRCGQRGALLQERQACVRRGENADLRDCESGRTHLRCGRRCDQRGKRLRGGHHQHCLCLRPHPRGKGGCRHCRRCGRIRIGAVCGIPFAPCAGRTALLPLQPLQRYHAR